MPDDLCQIDSTTTALLVMDYQPGIVAMLDDPEPVLTTVVDAITTVRSHGGHVGYVRVGFTDDELAQIPGRSPMAAAASRGPAIHADAPKPRYTNPDT